MSILDGVIFAYNWEDHITTSGPNKGRLVQRKKRVSGKGYSYREPPTQAMSEASALLERLDLSDPVSRAVASDALLDENRHQEVNLLRGVFAEGLIVHQGRLFRAHEVSPQVAVHAVMRELDLLPVHPQAINRAGIMGTKWSDWFHVTTVRNGARQPAGVVSIEDLAEKRSNSVAIYGLRSVAEIVLMNSRRFRRTQPDEPNAPYWEILMSGGAQYVRTWLEQTASKLEDAGADHLGLRYEVRSIPAQDGTMGYYYVLLENDPETGDPRRVTRGTTNLYKTLEEARYAASGQAYME